MAFVHGKDTDILLNGQDLSAFANTSQLTREADSHDVTTYGKQAHDYQGGLDNGTASIEGIYDDGAAGPNAIIPPLIGTKVPLVRRPEGVGAGKPEESTTVLVTSYVETNPVADMIAWSCALQLCDAVTSVAQV